VSRRPPAPGVGFALLAGLFAAGPALPALAQDGPPEVRRFDEHLDFDRPEAWALQYFASVTLLTGFGPPPAADPGSVELGLDVGWIPELGPAESEVGFRGAKQEDLNKAPVLVRPRLVVGLPRAWSLTVGWVPPVEAFDVEANLLSASIGRGFDAGGTWRWGVRAFGQTGSLSSDVTCPRDVAARGDDPMGNPSGCEAPSSDEVGLRYAGLELSVARAGAGRWVPHAAIAGSWLDLEMQVDALTFGFRDRTKLTAHGTRWSAAVGMHRRPAGEGRAPTVGLEVLYAPLTVDRPPDVGDTDDDLLNARALVTFRLR